MTKKFYRNIFRMFLRQTYHFSPNLSIWGYWQNVIRQYQILDLTQTDTLLMEPVRVMEYVNIMQHSKMYTIRRCAVRYLMFLCFHDLVLALHARRNIFCRLGGLDMKVQKVVSWMTQVQLRKDNSKSYTNCFSNNISAKIMPRGIDMLCPYTQIF